MRSQRAPKRTIKPDPLYHSPLVAKFINCLMRNGKKMVAQRLLYQAFSEIEKLKQNPLTVFDTAVANVTPKMEVRPRRIGGASYQVPVEVRGDRREALAIRWIIQAAASRPNKEYHTFDAKLAAELLEAAQNQGVAIKKKTDIHKVAEANRAFAHFRW